MHADVPYNTWFCVSHLADLLEHRESLVLPQLAQHLKPITQNRGNGDVVYIAVDSSERAKKAKG